jgi:hypothetical protein
VITDGLIHVHNELFLDQFKKQFVAVNLNISQDRLKQISNLENPLYHLINIDKQMKGQSQLISDLIQLTANKIQFNNDEIIRDAFEQPSRRTCIYVFLFEVNFKTPTTRQAIVDQLLALWNSWEKEGFRANHILSWKRFSDDERQIVERIWNYVGETAHKQYQIDVLIDKQGREMEEKVVIKEKITKCLEMYCPNLHDKQFYFDLLSEMETQLKSEIVRSIRIPEKIKILLPLADRLNPLEKLHAWRTFLADHQRSKISFISINFKLFSIYLDKQNAPSTTDYIELTSIIDDDTLLSDNSK